MVIKTVVAAKVVVVERVVDEIVVRGVVVTTSVVDWALKGVLEIVVGAEIVVVLFAVAPISLEVVTSVVKIVVANDSLVAG